MANQIILRPWGHYTPVDHSLTKVKINPNQTTELSRKPESDVALIVTEGECTVIINDNRRSLSRGEYYLVPAGTWCQFSNTYETPCKFIEITL